MGMDLYGKGGHFRWYRSQWYDVLVMAKLCGWKPYVRVQIDGGKWDDLIYYYWSNDGHRVYAKDGRAMAAALERALEPEMRKRLKARKRPRLGRWLFRKEEAAALREFITFLQAGAFRIC